MGIQSWSLRSAVDSESIDLEYIEEPQLAQEPQPDKKPQLEVKIDTTQEKLQEKSLQVFSDNSNSELQQAINHCQKCPSRQNRIHALSGQGNHNAQVFIIGDAPNAEEDRSDHYLSGQSGILFQAMLSAIGLEDNNYYTGLIKCFSMTDFIVREQDIDNCLPYLHRQIENIKPSVLFVLGAFAAQNLLKSSQSFNTLRGKIHSISINNKHYSVIVSYHPAYLLRNPLYKKESLTDLIMLKNLLQ